MHVLLIAASVLVGADAPKGPEPRKARPAALVLRVQGKVTDEGRVGKRHIGVGDYLPPGESVSTEAGAAATLLFLRKSAEEQAPLYWAPFILIGK